MKRLSVIAISLVTVLALAGAAAFAGDSPATPTNFGGNGQGFTQDGTSHYTNTHQCKVRMDWANQQVAVPGYQAGQNASSSTVSAHGGWTDCQGSTTLVAPPTSAH